MVGVRHLAPGRRPSHFFLLPSLACDTPVLCIMMITLCILRESVGKSNNPPPRFHHRDANLQPRGPVLCKTTGRIPPACPVFLLHTALITAGVSSLTACGAAVCTVRVDYAALQMVGALHTPSSHRPHPFTRECAPGVQREEAGRSRGNMSPGIIAPPLPLKDVFMSGK